MNGGVLLFRIDISGGGAGVINRRMWDLIDARRRRRGSKREGDQEYVRESSGYDGWGVRAGGASCRERPHC
jgi:hypothetical protein